MMIIMTTITMMTTIIATIMTIMTIMMIIAITIMIMMTKKFSPAGGAHAFLLCLHTLLVHVLLKMISYCAVLKTISL